MNTSRWWQQVTWYHLYPLGFLEAPAENPAPGAHDGPVEHRLPALHGWLDHLVELGIGGLLLGPVFESSTHGYDTVDPFRVDRRLGDEEDLRHLIVACRERGIRVVLDGVFNHVGRGHAAFREVLDRGRDASTAGWFHLDFDREGRDGFAYGDFEGHGELVALDHDEPAVLDWAVSVADHWLERGADGWRLDAAYRVPTSFWSAFAGRVRARHPEAFLLGEVIHGDYRRFVTEGRLDTVTQYELWKAVWSSLNDRNFFELAHALGRHATLCADTTPWVFLGNHDTTRIATQLRDARHLPHAVALLCTLPGVPAVYAGDELAAEGTKRHAAGGDDEIRRPPATERTPAAGTTLDLYRQLIAIRRANPWLSSASLDVVHLANETIAVELRDDGHRIVVALHTGDGPVEVPVHAGDLLAGASGPQLPPHGWGVWQG